MGGQTQNMHTRDPRYAFEERTNERINGLKVDRVFWLTSRFIHFRTNTGSRSPPRAVGPQIVTNGKAGARTEYQFAYNRGGK